MKKFLLLLLIPLNVLAQDATVTDVKKNNEHEEVPFEEGTSMENRRNRSVQFSLGPGIEFAIPIFSYTVGVCLKQKAVATLRYSERHDYTGDDGRKGLMALKLGYKKFVGNSFYYQPSVYYRRTSHQTTVTYKYRDAGLGLRIGNEWQWENFMLGIDWLGVNHSVAKIDEEVYPGTIVPPSIDVDKKFSFDFVGITVGYTF